MNKAVLKIDINLKGFDIKAISKAEIGRMIREMKLQLGLFEDELCEIVKISCQFIRL